MKKTQNISFWFLIIALSMLALSVIFGSLAAHSYTSPGFWKHTLGFIQLRPLHVTSALLWILMAAVGCIQLACNNVLGIKLSKVNIRIQLMLWIVSIIGIFYSYFTGTFGGREYWEFPPMFALPLALSWLLFLFDFIRSAFKIKDWPVYLWMWMTGLFFFLFTFTESYLWEFTYFREQFVKDMTIQWKASGSMVGSWNQLIYGLAFFLMERISGDTKTTRSKIAFTMYFLGLFNLMFNWSHHIYTLPTEQYIRYIGYTVSMTEWILFIRIIYNWKNTLTESQKFNHLYTYRFLLAADIWVFFNLGLALLLSIPAINIYTHGTHITVAHAMGTTIGINSMILLAGCFEFLPIKPNAKFLKWLTILFWTTQISLFLFWLNLLVVGIKKGFWQQTINQVPFQQMMYELHNWFRLFNYLGGILMTGLGVIAIMMISKFVQSFSHTK